MKKIKLKNIFSEDFNLVLPDGTINGDPKGKQKSNTSKYKKKEKMINEIAKHITFKGISFLVTLNILSSNRNYGTIQFIPKTSKDLDNVYKYGEDQIIFLLKYKLKNELGVNIFHDDDGSAGFKFSFPIAELEEMLINKIK
jgi:hypothetical protein